MFKAEDESLPTIGAKLGSGTTVYADEASSRDGLHTHYEVKRVNKSINCIDEEAGTNQAGSYFSQLRHVEIGTHHHISGRYLGCYAHEKAWREDHCGKPNGVQFLTVMAAAVLRQWKRYLQR